MSVTDFHQESSNCEYVLFFAFFPQHHCLSSYSAGFKTSKRSTAGGLHELKKMAEFQIYETCDLCAFVPRKNKTLLKPPVAQHKLL